MCASDGACDAPDEKCPDAEVRQAVERELPIPPLPRAPRALRYSERELWQSTDDPRVRELLARVARMRVAEQEALAEERAERVAREAEARDERQVRAVRAAEIAEQAFKDIEALLLSGGLEIRWPEGKTLEETMATQPHMVRQAFGNGDGDGADGAPTTMELTEVARDELLSRMPGLGEDTLLSLAQWG